MIPGYYDRLNLLLLNARAFPLIPETLVDFQRFQSPDSRHSSFHESLSPLWGLIEYYKVSGDNDVKESIERASELFLSHHLFRSHRTGKIIRKEWLKLRYPVYWHYNILQAMRILDKAGRSQDPRMSEGRDILESKIQPDGTWHADGTYWHPFSIKKPEIKHIYSNIDVVDWGLEGPNEMITLNSLRALKAAGRIKSYNPDGA